MALRESRSDDDEYDLQQKTGDQSAAPFGAEKVVDAGEDEAADRITADGRQGSRPVVRSAILLRGTQPHENGVSCLHGNESIVGCGGECKYGSIIMNYGELWRLMQIDGVETRKVWRKGIRECGERERVTHHCTWCCPANPNRNNRPATTNPHI